MQLQITNMRLVRIGVLTASAKHLSEIHMIINTVLKQSKMFKGNLKPEHTKKS